jgi:hypothetical protein
MITTSGDENHLCGASLCANHKIHHAHGILQSHQHGVGTPDYTMQHISQSQAEVRNCLWLHE